VRIGSICQLTQGRIFPFGVTEGKQQQEQKKFVKKTTKSLYFDFDICVNFQII
jgi:hypothetical protein